MRWFIQYKQVKNPFDKKSGWNFPYNGGDWPKNDDWYWVWAGSENHPEPYPSTPPKIAWWDSTKDRFLAIDGEVIAWRKAVRLRQTDA